MISHTAWEYEFVDCDDDKAENTALYDMGRNGWELVCSRNLAPITVEQGNMHGQTFRTTYVPTRLYFKRSLP